MPTAYEQSTTEREIVGGGVEITRVYRVDAPPSSAVVPPIPNVGGTLGGLTVRELSKNRVANNLTDVTVRAYSATASGFLPPPPVDFTDASRAVWSTDTVNIENVIPYATGVTKRVGTVAGGLIIGYWQGNEETVTDDGTIVRLEVTVSSFPQSSWQTIGNQANNIHTIGGRQYKFLQGSTRQIAANSWLINYEWLYDPGTTQILGTVAAGGTHSQVEGQILFPGAGMGYETPTGSTAPADGLMRMPYHGLRYIPSATPAAAPTVLHSVKGTPDPSGYTGLPGVGSLP